MSFRDDFVAQYSNDYGHGMFCTPDVLDKIEATLAERDRRIAELEAVLQGVISAVDEQDPLRLCERIEKAKSALITNQPTTP